MACFPELSDRTSLYLITIFTILAIPVEQIYGYSSGAPTSQCTTLTPGHGVSSQTSASPYSIVPQFRNYGPSTLIEVNMTADSGYTFKGFIVQARVKGQSEPIGIMSIYPSSTSQRLNCNGGSNVANTLTHVDATQKTSVVFSWTAPNYLNGDVLEFVGTFVQKYNTIWTNVKSVDLTDACNPSPCHNGGTCYRSGTQGYFCTCPDEFKGTNCTEVESVCQAETCGVYGTQCLQSGDNPSSFVCRCADESFSFDQPCPVPTSSTIEIMTTITLETDTPSPSPSPSLTPTPSPSPTPTPTLHPCSADPNPCHNAGYCFLNSGDNIQCICSGGYTGTYCEISPACRTSPCQNGGVCSTGESGDYVCTCDGIYTGPECQYTVGCASIPCQNDALCTSTGSYARDYTCSCTSMYTGTNCETELDPCTSEPCLNGGQCYRRGDMMGYMCLCINGYTGATCDTAPPPTTEPPTMPTTQPPPTPTTNAPTTLVVTTEPSVAECEQDCQNGGTCVNGVCQCPNGFGGPRCEQDYRPIFTSCPEGETLIYVLEQDSNVATIDLDPITATDFQGSTLDVDFIMGPNLNAISSLEFSEDYSTGQAVVAQAVDSEGRSSNCTFSIRLEDRQSPAITCPSDIVEVTADSTLRVTWEDAVAEDNADSSPVMTYSPQQSGTVFQADGESVSIIARATDSSANYQECVFQITVYQRDYDCDEFPSVANGEVTCQVTESGRQCRVACDSGFVNTVGSNTDYTCIADSAGTFWDPTPSSGICARAELGRGVTKTATVSFPLASASCPGDDSFKSAAANNITSSLDAKGLCTVGTASACQSDSITTTCFNSGPNIAKRDAQNNLFSRVRRQSSALFVDIDVYSPTSGGSDQTQIEGDVDALASGIKTAADNGEFELTVNGEVIANNPDDTQVDSEFRWSCDQGQVTSNAGCVDCPQGTYYDVDINACVFCSLGTYQDQVAQTMCQECPTGSSTDAAGSASESSCMDKTATSLNLTSTQWILVYIACGVAGIVIVILLISLLVCCCRKSDDSPREKKGTDMVDGLPYLNRAFEDDSLPDEMQYNATLPRNGTLQQNSHVNNGYIGNGDTRLIEIPSDPEYLYAEVPVTSFSAREREATYAKSMKSVNGSVRSVSAGIDLDSLPNPPAMAAPPPPPPPPPSESKPLRMSVINKSFPPPPPDTHQFSNVPGESAPSVPAPPPPPPPPANGGPPPPPLPPVRSANNSHTNSPTGSTASGRSGRRLTFQM